MNSKNIIENVPRESESFRDKSASELREMLDRELSKPDKQIDYGLVDRLTTSVLEVEGRKRLAVDVDDELDKFRNRVSKRNRKFFLPKWAVSLSVACIVLFCANCISVSAWSMNIFKALVDFVQGGVLIGFEDRQEESVIELPTSENDKYGIREKCAEYGVYPLVPEYLPDGFQLSDITIDDENTFTLLVFSYVSGKRKISISYTKYHDSKDIPSILVPSDTHNITEKEINGQTMYILEEDNQFTATFLKNDIMYLIFTDRLEYKENDKIIKSLV